MAGVQEAAEAGLSTTADKSAELISQAANFDPSSKDIMGQIMKANVDTNNNTAKESAIVKTHSGWAQRARAASQG
jgi:hypothetical protein